MHLRTFFCLCFFGFVFFFASSSDNMKSAFFWRLTRSHGKKNDYKANHMAKRSGKLLLKIRTENAKTNNFRCAAKESELLLLLLVQYPTFSHHFVAFFCVVFNFAAEYEHSEYQTHTESDGAVKRWAKKGKKREIKKL